MAVVNALGSAVIGGGPHFWAGGYEVNGGIRRPRLAIPDARRGPPCCAGRAGRNRATTIAIIATDAVLDKAQATRLAIAANDGLARALSLTHAPFDGDTIFAAATGRKPLVDPAQDLTALCALAGTVLARAVARGVYEAQALPFEGALPAWRDRFTPGG